MMNVILNQSQKSTQIMQTDFLDSLGRANKQKQHLQIWQNSICFVRNFLDWKKRQVLVLPIALIGVTAHALAKKNLWYITSNYNQLFQKIGYSPGRLRGKL